MSEEELPREAKRGKKNLEKTHPSMGMPAAIHFLTWATMPVVSLG